MASILEWFKDKLNLGSQNQYNQGMADELKKTSDDDLAILKDAYPSNGYVKSELARRNKSSGGK